MRGQRVAQQTAPAASATTGDSTGRRRRVEGRADADPRRGPRALAAQLAAQEHDGAQVLHRHGEAQLRHEVGSAHERPRRGAGRDTTTATTASTTDDGDADQVDGFVAHAPQGEAADRVAGPRELPAIAAPWAASTTHGECRWPASGGSGRRGRARRRRRTARPWRRRRRRRWPPRPRASRAGGGRRAGRRCRRRAAPLKAIDRRRCTTGGQQHVAPGHGGQQEVADVGGLDRDRAAVAAAAQPEGDGERGERAPSTAGPWSMHVGDLGRRRRVVGRPGRSARR